MGALGMGALGMGALGMGALGKRARPFCDTVHPKPRGPMAKSSVKVGDVAPDFSLPSNRGRNVSLSEFKGKKAVVLFFYPKDNTPGCTAEACDFRDSHARFVGSGAEVIGVSEDSVASHEQFATKHDL